MAHQHANAQDQSFTREQNAVFNQRVGAHRRTKAFKKFFSDLSKEDQVAMDRAFKEWLTEPEKHPHRCEPLKCNPQGLEFRSGRSVRAIAKKFDNGHVVWVWCGSHGQFDKIATNAKLNQVMEQTHDFDPGPSVTFHKGGFKDANAGSGNHASDAQHISGKPNLAGYRQIRGPVSVEPLGSTHSKSGHHGGQSASSSSHRKPN